MKILQKPSHWTIRMSLLGCISCCLMWIPSGVGFAQEEEAAASGKPAYLEHCATCHGARGKGDGATAELLTVRPADLTQLRKNYGGDFPFWRVYRMIDGREQIRGHGTREMPIWGAVFRKEAGGTQTSHVRGRILELVYFLKSIQDE